MEDKKQEEKLPCSDSCVMLDLDKNIIKCPRGFEGSDNKCNYGIIDRENKYHLCAKGWTGPGCLTGSGVCLYELNCEEYLKTQDSFYKPTIIEGKTEEEVLKECVDCVLDRGRLVELVGKVEESTVEPPKKEIKLDREKASYLFSEEEINDIEKDLNTNVSNSDLSRPRCEGIDKNLNGLELNNISEEKDKELNQMWLDHTEKILDSYSKGLNDPNGVRLLFKGDKAQVVDTRSEDIRLKNVEEIKAIEKKLANQKGLSKIWAINEKFNVGSDANVTEEEAFKKELEYSKKYRNMSEEDYSNEVAYSPKFYRDNKGYLRKDISKELFPIVCPLCDGDKHIKIGFFKVKCFKCKQAGKVMVKSAEYREIVNKNPEAAWKEEVEVREHKDPIVIYKDRQEDLV